MEGIGPIIIIAFIVIVILMMMAGGRKMKYYCHNCGHKWKWKKHHGQTAPSCPKCGSTDISRRS